MKQNSAMYTGKQHQLSLGTTVICILLARIQGQTSRVDTEHRIHKNSKRTFENQSMTKIQNNMRKVNLKQSHNYFKTKVIAEFVNYI